MEKLNLSIPIPKIIMNLVLFFLLRYRKKHYGFAFRRIKLIGSKHVDIQHRYARVDYDDYQKLAQYDWQLFVSGSKNYYAGRTEGRKIVSMHRIIINAPKGGIVDHKNGNGLDNRKENLRIATISQNQYNRRKTSKKTSSKYKGVYLRKQTNKYSASIGCSGKCIFLGYFKNEEDAAKAYDKAAVLYHGEFAVLNFPQNNPLIHQGVQNPECK